ncbi:MAG: hypothetical protein J3K34DRAFT_390082 [Monoraphidium minutum]|nr:MAG: hypothetical protein J3K34DRAFT_390082 [Monoraphidium minutum]
MPRLSDYLSGSGCGRASDPLSGTPASGGSPGAAAKGAQVLSLAPQPGADLGHAGAGQRAAAAGSGVAALPGRGAGVGASSTTTSGGGASAAAAAAAAAAAEAGGRIEAGIARLQQLYARRLRDHGPRRYRWADGALAPVSPPAAPLAVANRRRWAPLVQHCRHQVAADPGLVASGAVALYGAGGLAIEAEGGAWRGFQAGREDPIEDDASHPLWGEEWGPAAAAVLERAQAIGNVARASGRGGGLGATKAARASSPLSGDSEASFVVV